jgi:hypothetical protein
MRYVGLVGAGIVFGCLTSGTWSDPGCQLGLVVFLIATAVMTLGFGLAVGGHGRNPDAGDPDEGVFRRSGHSTLRANHAGRYDAVEVVADLHEGMLRSFALEIPQRSSAARLPKPGGHRCDVGAGKPPAPSPPGPAGCGGRDR